MLSNFNTNQKEISVAPMMDWTDRHCRYFLRLIAPSVRLYTEMVTAQAILYGDKNYLLAYRPAEKPLALQLGGSDPALLQAAAKIGAEAGYDEINLNLGCPSPRVCAGRFGASLMLVPELVVDCVTAMCEAVKVPVTVKCRTGVDHQDSFEALLGFVEKIQRAGCQKMIIHARKAWLSGLSPKENRDIPPLQYDWVKMVKQIFPALKIILNGGLTTLSGVQSLLDHVDGVMIGRAAYHRPWFLREIAEEILGETNLPDRNMIIEAMTDYAREEIKNGVRLHAITRHMLGFYHGLPGGARWRRYLSTESPRRPNDINIIQEGLSG